MKIGIVADIHGDLTSLLDALELLREQGVDQIVCAGDLLEKGPDGDAVVQVIRTEAIPCVRGNHDWDALGNQRWLRTNSDLTHPAVAVRLLRESTLRYVNDLPLTLHYEWAGKRVLLAHGAPWSASEYVYAVAPPPFLQKVVQDVDIVILGHTHRPMRVRVGQAWIVNPGSVCKPDVGGTHTCGILTLPDVSFEVYDINTRRPLIEGVAERVI